MKKNVLRTSRYLEYDIVGNCNLNCKGCSHFSNLQTEEQYVKVETYEKDIKRISQLVKKIGRIKILGGEPLLHPQLDEIITRTREILPNAIIDMVTNGILINKVEQKTWDAMRKCRITLWVTIYKNTEKMKKQILETLESQNISYRFYEVEEKEKFRRQLTKEKRSRAWISHQNCEIKKCIGIKNGLLGKCPMSIHMDRYNKRFSTHFPEDEFINIYDENITPRDIEKFIQRPIELCKYCSTEHDFFEWEVADAKSAKEEDWISKYNKGGIIGNIKAFIYVKMKLAWQEIERKSKKIEKRIQERKNISKEKKQHS